MSAYAQKPQGTDLAQSTKAGILADLSRLAGNERVASFRAEFGRRRIYLPRIHREAQPTIWARIASHVGPEIAQELQITYGGQFVYIS